MKHLRQFFFGVSSTMISTLAIDCLSHPDFSRESLRHSHFAVMRLVCSTDRKQNINTIRKECCSDVSSRFFGGALRDIPKNCCEGDYVQYGERRKVPRGGNLTFSKCLGVGNLTLASMKMSNSAGSDISLTHKAVK